MANHVAVVKFPRPGAAEGRVVAAPTGDDVAALDNRGNGRGVLPSVAEAWALEAGEHNEGDVGEGDGGGIDGDGIGNLVASDSDAELDRLWDRLNSLKGEIPAVADVPPPPSASLAGHGSQSIPDGGLGVRTGGATGGGGDDVTAGDNAVAPGAYGISSSQEERLEAWAHRREIAGKLEEIQRALSTKAADGKRRQDELEVLHERIQELEAYVELEVVRRQGAERHAARLEAGLQVMADRCDREATAREAAESNAKRCMDLITEARVAWQRTQDIVQKKERELAAAEERAERQMAEPGGGGSGDFSCSLQRRLEDARKSKELEKQHSASLKLALEGGGGESAASSGSAAAATIVVVPSAEAGHSSDGVGGAAVGVRGGTERSAVEVVEATPLPPSRGLEGVRLAAAEARLQAAIEEAAAAAATTSARRASNGEAIQRRESGSKQHPQARRQRHQAHEHHHHQQQQDGAKTEPRRFSEKTTTRPRVVPVTKDRPELGGGDVFRGLGGAPNVATTSINDSSGGGGGGACYYSGTALNHDRFPKEASYVEDYFGVGDASSSIGAESYHRESSTAYRDVGGRRGKNAAVRRPGMYRETVVKIKSKVGSAMVKAMNDGGKNMKVDDSKRGTELIAALCSVSSGFGF